ncbi:hypothetical protein QUA56_29950 [Microcoleus sp. N3A4]|uniref:hypothetical protein n=1 Tax=Cyanophyceae TaxID=3028117 RepID=UPI002FD2C726
MGNREWGIGNGELGMGNREWGIGNGESGMGPKNIGLVYYNSHLAPFSRTGKMPVPQKINFLASQAGEPVHKRLIENGATSQL